MLFDPDIGLGGYIACFSPSVSSLYRKTWVQYGGKLTHSEEDFNNARYFFCSGMSDPWLEPLLARCLIVLHPAWIMECVEQAFRMPVTKYVLDDLFDKRCIEERYNMNIDSPGKESKGKAGKRTIDQMNTSVSLLLEARPRKKQRVQSPSASIELEPEIPPDSRPRRFFCSSPESTEAAPCYSPVPFITPIKKKAMNPRANEFWTSFMKVEDVLGMEGTSESDTDRGVTVFVPGVQWKGREMLYLGKR